MIDLLAYLKSSIPRAAFIGLLLVISPVLAILVIAIMLDRYFLHDDPILEILRDLQGQFKTLRED